MTKISKGEFISQLPTLINDNIGADVTPAKHRSVETDMADSVPWLEDSNTFEGSVVLQGIFRVEGEELGTTSISQSKSIHINVDGEFVNFNLPSSPVDWESHVFINAYSGDNTISGNGKQIFNYSDVSTVTVISGQSMKFLYYGTKWYVIH